MAVNVRLKLLNLKKFSNNSKLNCALWDLRVKEGRVPLVVNGANFQSAMALAKNQASNTDHVIQLELTQLKEWFSFYFNRHFSNRIFFNFLV